MSSGIHEGTFPTYTPRQPSQRRVEAVKDLARIVFDGQVRQVQVLSRTPLKTPSQSGFD